MLNHKHDILIKISKPVKDKKIARWWKIRTSQFTNFNKLIRPKVKYQNNNFFQYADLFPQIVLYSTIKDSLSQCFWIRYTPFCIQEGIPLQEKFRLKWHIKQCDSVKWHIKQCKQHVRVKKKNRTVNITLKLTPSSYKVKSITQKTTHMRERTQHVSA